jgi:hypothetical protein
MNNINERRASDPDNSLDAPVGSRRLWRSSATLLIKTKISRPGAMSRLCTDCLVTRAITKVSPTLIFYLCKWAGFVPDLNHYAP